MASEQGANVHDDTIDEDDTASDYGSDLDSATLDEVFSQSFSQTPAPTCANEVTVKVEDVDEPLLPQQDDSEAQTNSLRLTRIREDLDVAIESNGHTSNQLARIRESLNEALIGIGSTSTQLSPRNLKWERSVEIEYDQSNRDSFSAVQVGEVEIKRESPPSEEIDVKDTRSPIDRFRKAPKKPLSVTDLVSPAWCELQYWYSLTKYGRIKRTPAMVQGSKIHKEKEREVHTEVPVEIVTQEDRLGLRMWNIIQGLRTLRATGLTRELEVFGTIDGEVIIGIIDELSYNCPDEALEMEVLEAAAKAGGEKGKKKMTLLPDQTTMNDFFSASQENANILNSQAAWLLSAQSRKPLYLLDIKTRKSKSMPKLGSQMRPMQMQLMLYRRLLHDLAGNKVDADKIFTRYGLNSNAQFSDTFIAALGAIDFSSSQRSAVDVENGEFETPDEQDPLEEILAYKTLGSLWAHMIAEFAKTISVNAQSTSISPLLTAEFRASADGALIGQRSFPFENDTLDKYVESEMQWWRGERETRGVDIEEAYKCGMCEFAEGCTWRIGKIEEAAKKARLRNQTRARSQI